MKKSQEDAILIKKNLSGVWCTKAAEWISRLRLETWKHRQAANENPQDEEKLSGNQAAEDAFVA